MHMPEGILYVDGYWDALPPQRGKLPLHQTKKQKALQGLSHSKNPRMAHRLLGIMGNQAENPQNEVLCIRAELGNGKKIARSNADKRVKPNIIAFLRNVSLLVSHFG